MATFDDEDKRMIKDMHTAIVQQQTIIENVVVNKDACEKKRKEIYETINGCAKTQCAKIETAGKAGKGAMLLAGAIGSMIAIAIALIMYLVTCGG